MYTVDDWYGLMNHLRSTGQKDLVLQLDLRLPDMERMEPDDRVPIPRYFLDTPGGAVLVALSMRDYRQGGGQ